jgi:hypothetical protein
MDKIEKSRLTSYHRLPLHLLHAFLSLLVVIFLILGGTSGPQTGYWWLKIEYTRSTAGKSDMTDGGIWYIGGLGGCVLGIP